MRSVIQPSPLPARFAHVVNVARRSWKRSGSMLGASAKRASRFTPAARRSARSASASVWRTTAFSPFCGRPPPRIISVAYGTTGSSALGLPGGGADFWRVRADMLLDTFERYYAMKAPGTSMEL